MDAQSERDGDEGHVVLMDEEEQGPKKLKNLQVLVLSVALLSNSISITVLFPFLKFMIEDMGIDEKDAGNYVGLVASAFMIGRASTAVLWGMFADRFGRKPPILMSLVSLAVLAPLFGISKTVTTAAALRFLAGALNSIIGIGKVVANEIASDDPMQQARAMSAVSFSWSAGNILGPGVGGLLTGVYADEPYLPPMLLVGGLCAVSFVLVFAYLPETLVKKPDEKRGSIREFVTTWSLMHPVLVYCLWSWQALGTTELFNLWGGTDRALGGLGLEPSQLGMIQSITGAVVLVNTSLVQAPLIVYWGVRSLSLLSIILVIPVIACMPLLRYVGGPVETMIAACVMFPAIQLLTGVVFCTQFMFINNTNTPSSRALAQGVAMCLASCFKSFGPISTGSLFAWSIANPHSYPFNFAFTWYAQAGIAFVTLALTLCLPHGIDAPRALQAT